MQTHEEIYRHLRELREELSATDAFAAYRVEIAGGEIVMMMSPARQHGLAAKRLVQQLDAQLPEPLEAFENTDTEDVRLGRLRVPDVMVVPTEAMERGEAPMDPREIRLAVEVVSRSNPENDYTAKVADYAAMGIPHYLIVDPRDGSCVHYFEIGSRSGKPVYEGRIPYRFGDRIKIAGLAEIDTSVLPRYDDVSA